MRPNNREYSVSPGKVEDMRCFQTLGYTVIAMLDNEPENLAVHAAHEHRRELLPMHADTLYLSSDIASARPCSCRKQQQPVQ